jgi:ribosomal protein L7/L12
MSDNIELEPEVLAAINSGRKIEAIKELRSLRGIGLKEAKGLVEAYSEIHSPKDASVEKVRSSNGVIGLIIFGVAFYLLYNFIIKQ